VKFAVCSELLADRPLSDACAEIARHGYEGIEIAPFRLADDPLALRGRRAAALRRTVEQAGLRVVGLHWLLAGPGDCRLTDPEAGVRARSWDTLHRLAELCGELGGAVMVLGAGRQRAARGIEPAAAVDLLRQGLTLLAPHAHAAGCAVLLEALPAGITNVVNTLQQAAALVREVAHPGLAGMFDFHNCDDESASWAELLERHFGMIRHVHLNDPQGGHPCLQRLSPAQREAYRAAFRVLRERAYPGWVSLEIFRFDQPVGRVLAETRRALDQLAGPAGSEAAGA